MIAIRALRALRCRSQNAAAIVAPAAAAIARNNALVRALWQSIPSHCPHMRSFSADSRAAKGTDYQRHVGLTRVRLSVRGGKGGSGCSSFHRDLSGRGSVHGSSSGGNGGKGGAVYVTCESSLSMANFDFSTHHYAADNGERGASQGKTGRQGEDMHIRVPPNTRVFIVHNDYIADTDSDTGAETQSFNGRRVSLVADLTENESSLLVCQGGAGGFGNRALMSDSSVYNKFSTDGQPGEHCELLLEMTVIADVGCVGYPNAGKSSLLNALTRARPKIAPYPFTTIRPQVGVVEASAAPLLPVTDVTDAESFAALSLIDPNPSTSMPRLTLADLPGLINDAHKNVGLGHSFLAHLQRCSVLVYVIDVSGATNDTATSALLKNKYRSPSEDFLALRRELRLYDQSLITDKPWIVFANQLDRKPKTAAKHLSELREVVDSEVRVERETAIQSFSVQCMSGWSSEDICVGGSCVDQRGLSDLVQRMQRMVERVNAARQREKAAMEAEQMRLTAEKAQQAALRPPRRLQSRGRPRARARVVAWTA